MFKSIIHHSIVLTALICSYATTANAAVTYTVENGNLMSAQGIIVGGSLYDVEFVDGTFNNLFPTGTSIPSVNSFNEVLAFGNALLDQVFIDGPSGLWDSSPTLTNGCEFANYCEMIVPIVNTSVNFVSAFNSATDTTFVDFQTQVGDFVVTQNLDRNYPTDQFNHRTFAKFTQQSVSPVPEVPNQVLLAVGSLILLGMSRRNRSKA